MGDRPLVVPARKAEVQRMLHAISLSNQIEHRGERAQTRGFGWRVMAFFPPYCGVISVKRF